MASKQMLFRTPTLLPSSAVAGVMGNANQKCCVEDAVPCYGGAMSSGNCVGQLPWNCTCLAGISGTSCWKVTNVRMTDVCIAGNPSDLTEETFRIDFAPGTTVRDFGTERVYRVGYDDVELRSRIASQVDSVRTDLRRQVTTDEPADSRWPSVGLAAGLAIGLAWLAWRVVRHARASALVIGAISAALSSAPTALCANMAETAQWTSAFTQEAGWQLDRAVPSAARTG